MLSLPLNRGSSVDIKSGFATLLQSQYCDNFAEKLNPDIIGYQKLRDNCVLISEPSETSIQTILRLHLHYSNFVPRLNGYQSELRVQFQWIDGFRSSKSAMSNCLFVDWACMLWNLAALESQLGARMERGTDEGVKNASKHFQQAAGIIDFILTGVFPYCSINPLSALTHTGLTMGRDLMLAQAQLCFFEKAVRDKNAGKMKPGVVAKLAIQTAAYFDQVKASCIQEPLNTTLDPSWLHHTDFQSACLHAAADYWQGLASKEVAVEKGSGYAEEIARLTRAERTLTHAIATAQKNRVSASASGDGLLNIIKTTKAKAIADNSSVYMESVPSEASLSVIPPASLVKLAPIPEISFTENIFFRDVLPSQVRQLRGDFHNQMDIILTNASTEAGTASTAARATLSDLGLPSSLEAYKFGGKLPDNLWTKISRIQNMGQKAELISKLGLLEVAAGRCVHSMATIFESLQQEERVDATFRDRFPQWDGVSSAALCVDLRSTWSLLKEAFAQAQDKDRAAKAELNDSDFDQQLMMLSKSRNEISALLPSAVAATGGVDTSGLEAKLVEMATIIEHRERALAALEQLSNRDISDLLLAQCTVKGASEQSVALASVVDDLVESAKPHVDFIQSSIVRQQTLLADIDHANLQFVQAQSSDPLTQQRNSALQQMEQALTRFQNLHAQLLAGLTFYANFQVSFTVTLSSIISFTIFTILSMHT